MSNSDDVDGYTAYVCTGIYIEFFTGERGGGDFVASNKKANKRHFRSYLMMTVTAEDC